jgi:hypothetical protein
MIRIDEIYHNTFWPWIRENRPGTRLFVCDPFGRSDPDSVINYGRDDIQEYNYIFFFDQEPIHLAQHLPTFQWVEDNNIDYYHSIDNYCNIWERPNSCTWEMPYRWRSGICTSEKNSENVDAICNRFGLDSHYYFFHGWAALDWYRGYDKTFLIRPFQSREITKTFIAPNRIIAGERRHRLEMLYYIFKYGMIDNNISCPAVCPVENISILDAVAPLKSRYPDIEDVFSAQSLPINFANETGHPMHSCWLSLFDESAESLLYLVSETVATGRRWHLTEKTFKPIALGMPFVIVGTRGSLEYLRSYGFRTFGDIWDESYDNADDDIRIEKIAKLLKELDDQTIDQKQKIFESAHDVIEHNWNHFYNGGFESVLWAELQEMLNGIELTCGPHD